MIRRILCPLAMLLCYGAAHGAPPDLVMVAPTDLGMPLVQFQDDRLTGGILKDLGDALAQRLGRHASYLKVDVDGVSNILSSGTADGVCYVRPIWIDGDYNWSSPFMPDAELVASRETAPQIHSLTDLRDQPIGTVAGYRYPRVEQVLGASFVRSEAPTMEQNLSRLMSGEVQYTILGQANLVYEMHRNKAIKLRSNLVFATFKAQCAFSRRARVPFAEVNQAINSLLSDGSIERILARYR